MSERDTHQFMADLIHQLQPSRNVISFQLTYNFQERNFPFLTCTFYPVLEVDPITGELPVVTQEYVITAEPVEKEPDDG